MAKVLEPRQVLDDAYAEVVADISERGFKAEIDDEGNIIVTPPGADEHVAAGGQLIFQLMEACPDGYLVMPEMGWAPRGGTTPMYVPDVAVVSRACFPRQGWALREPPLLVVEVLSPGSYRRDLDVKAAAYFDGGARAYWTVEVPGLRPTDEPALTVRYRGETRWLQDGPLHGRVTVELPVIGPVSLDLGKLVL